MKHAFLILLLGLAPLSAWGETKPKQDFRYISLSDTRVLSKPSAFSKAITKLSAGTRVEVKGKSGAYLKIQLGTVAGWIPSRAVQAKRPKIGYSSVKSTSTGTAEIAAATKGFNSDVEGQYKEQNPQLNYSQLDSLEERTAVADPIGSLEDFRRKGKLGEFSGKEASHD